MTLAAIDIGSNAVRLLIMQVTPQEDGDIDFTKLNFLRIPLRLGMDVFNEGIISAAKIEDLKNTMSAYALLMKIYQVEHYRACATSAMRDAANSKEVIETIQSETGITIELLSGSQEAGVVYEAHIEKLPDSDQPYLYIDVGGGSTELALFFNNEIIFQESFNVGTIRMLNRKVTDTYMGELKEFVKTRSKGFKNLKAIGTGGNINKLHSMSKLKDNKPLSLILLKAYLNAFEKYTVEERMHLYNLRRDRADVIVPALQIYIAVMRWANIEEIYVPKVGLADGMIKLLYEEYTK